MTTESLCSIGQQQQQQHQLKQTTIDSNTKALDLGKEETNKSNRTTGSSSIRRIAQDTRAAAVATTRTHCDTLSSCIIEDSFEDRSRLIDSRSILTNKEKLKKFWEQKMEMEFKLRQQEQSLRSNSAKKVNGKQHKVVNFAADVNNNNNGDTNNNNNNDNESATDNNNKQQVADQDWHSLSPNTEPTNGIFKQTPALRSKQQVSAQLVCEKLREYQATGAASQRQADGRGVPAVPDTVARDRSNKVPNNSSTNSVVSNRNSGHTEEIQLMSIDPVLCHLNDTQVNELSNSNQEPADNGLNYLISSNQSLSSNDQLISYNELREEQTVNEEFSSSSSSFGPMSITVQTNLTSKQGEDGNSHSKHNEQEEEEEEDNDNEEDEEPDNSTQSGSVLTVITKADNQLAALSINEDLDKENSNAFSTATDSERNEVINFGSEDGGDEMEEDEEAFSSNIGVAFESLHFDSEIKSSKQEKVDEELLINAPTPAKRPLVSKFNANEVKSVCNFITAAISDATRQVESYMNLSNSSSKSNQEVESEVISDRGLQKNGASSDSSSIQRATFVQESPDSSTTSSTDDHRQVQISTVESVDQLGDKEEQEEEEEEEEAEVPSADLSSIFEANVRREIEKFETNSMVKKSSLSGGKLAANKNALTEWRIAEEIRLFNEREMELKRRFEGSSKVIDRQGAAPNQQVVNGQPDSIKSSRSGQNESVVRFGKTLHIPKPIQSVESSSHLSKGIKLTSVNTSNNNNQQTMISMHKFISSGGKRFVFTSTSNGNNNSNLQSQLLTKSMSNLSTTSNRNETVAMPKTVDYKAVDSLKCKETPNVKPGLTRKVIETFSRMNYGCKNESTVSNNNNNNNNNKPQQQQQMQQQSNGSNHQANNHLPTAEWKIQEELREMRAREAELRDQRNHMGQNQPSQLDNVNSNGLKSEVNNVKDYGDDHVEDVEQVNCETSEQLKAKDNLEASEQKSLDRLSFSTESLYPIKQTIDSFRKLNSSQANKQVPLSQLKNVTTIQRKFLQGNEPNGSNEDYDSKVGGQRRKISMIERWENKMH